MSNAKILVVVALLASVSRMSEAQRSTASTKKGSACRIDERSAWFRKQHEWFDDAKHTWSDDMLRRRLLASAGLVEASPLAVQGGWLAAEAPRTSGDSVMIAALRATAATRGSTWPTRSVVGGEGVRAVWLLALRDTALARAALKRMMEAGPDESNSADVATLEDRVRLASGRKQIYGTQLIRDANGVRLAPMEDSAHADLRREEAGLPSLAQSLCLARATKE
jgi:hypothetical protein